MTIGNETYLRTHLHTSPRLCKSDQRRNKFQQESSTKYCEMARSEEVMVLIQPPAALGHTNVVVVGVGRLAHNSIVETAATTTPRVVSAKALAHIWVRRWQAAHRLLTSGLGGHKPGAASRITWPGRARQGDIVKGARNRLPMVAREGAQRDGGFFVEVSVGALSTRTRSRRSRRLGRVLHVAGLLLLSEPEADKPRKGAGVHDDEAQCNPCDMVTYRHLF